MSVSAEPTFSGYVETTQDALLIFEGSKRGVLPRISRRLQERERRVIRSGTVFVFDERESGIKRWTDGMVWSPSRILNNFLVYRELDRRSTSQQSPASSSMQRPGLSSREAGSHQSSVGPRDDFSQASSSGASMVYSEYPPATQQSSTTPFQVSSPTDRAKERALVGSLTSSSRFKQGGLVKKTMSVTIDGVPQHLVSYYTIEDAASGQLATPSATPELKDLDISPEFLQKTNFRVPPHVEGMDYPYDIEGSGFGHPHIGMGGGMTPLGMQAPGSYDALAHESQYIPSGFPGFSPMYSPESQFSAGSGATSSSVPGPATPYIGGHPAQIFAQRPMHSHSLSEAGYLPLGDPSSHDQVHAGRQSLQGTSPQSSRSPVTFMRRSAVSHQRHRSQHSGSFSSSSSLGHSRQSSLASSSGTGLSPSGARSNFNPSFPSLVMSPSRPPYVQGYSSGSGEGGSVVSGVYGVAPTGSPGSSTSFAEGLSGAQASSPLRAGLGIVGAHASYPPSPTRGFKRERAGESLLPAADLDLATSSTGRTTGPSTSESSATGRRHRRSGNIPYSTLIPPGPAGNRPTGPPYTVIPSATTGIETNQVLAGLGVSGMDLVDNPPTSQPTTGEGHYGHFDNSRTVRGQTTPHTGSGLSWSDIYGTSHNG